MNRIVVVGCQLLVGQPDPDRDGPIGRRGGKPGTATASPAASRSPPPNRPSAIQVPPVSWPSWPFPEVSRAVVPPPSSSAQCATRPSVRTSAAGRPRPDAPRRSPWPATPARRHEIAAADLTAPPEAPASASATDSRSWPRACRRSARRDEAPPAGRGAPSPGRRANRRASATPTPPSNAADHRCGSRPSYGAAPVPTTATLRAPAPRLTIGRTRLSRRKTAANSASARL